MVKLVSLLQQYRQLFKQVSKVQLTIQTRYSKELSDGHFNRPAPTDTHSSVTNALRLLEVYSGFTCHGATHTKATDTHRHVSLNYIAAHKFAELTPEKKTKVADTCHVLDADLIPTADFLEQLAEYQALTKQFIENLNSETEEEYLRQLFSHQAAVLVEKFPSAIVMQALHDAHKKITLMKPKVVFDPERFFKLDKNFHLIEITAVKAWPKESLIYQLTGYLADNLTLESLKIFKQRYLVTRDFEVNAKSAKVLASQSLLARNASQPYAPTPLKKRRNVSMVNLTY